MKRYGSPYWNLLWELTRCEFKLRDQGTVLGFLWTLLHPALMFLVLYQLFTKVFSKYVSDYPLYMILGLVQWNFFATATNNALSCFYRKSKLVLNFNFPREILVLSSVGVVLWSYLIELAIALLITAVWGRTFAWSWLYFPLLLAAQVLWVLGLSFFLAYFGVKYKDMERIWGIFVNIGFFLVPIFYPIQLIAEPKRFLISLNPLVFIMNGTRDCLLRGQVPSLAFTAFLILSGTGAAWLGLRWMRAYEKGIVDHIFL